MSINIRDIAKASGVSIATVSRVISGKPGVGEETIERVRSVIEELGYRPNISARGLAKRSTGNIGIVSPRESGIVLGNPFFSSILDGVSGVLDRLDYNMLLSFTLTQQQRLLETHSVDGIIIMAARKDDIIMDWLRDTPKIPKVIIGSYWDDTLPYVRPNDEQGIYTAVKHLINYGHREIVLVNGPYSSRKSVRCEEGFLKAMEEAGLEVDKESIIVSKEYDMSSACFELDQYLSNHSIPTAIVCASDYLALGVLKAAEKHGINVPHDLSVIGFGDVPSAKFSKPELTTMHTNLPEIGKQAAVMLTSLIQGKKIRITEKVFSMELVERMSVRNLSSGSD